MFCKLQAGNSSADLGWAPEHVAGQQVWDSRALFRVDSHLPGYQPRQVLTDMEGQREQAELRAVPPEV